MDSAWLRYDIAAGDPDRGQLGPRDRVLVEHVSVNAPADVPGSRGWLVIEGDAGEDPFAAVGAAVRAYRSR